MFHLFFVTKTSLIICYERHTCSDIKKGCDHKWRVRNWEFYRPHTMPTWSKGQHASCIKMGTSLIRRLSEYNRIPRDKPERLIWMDFSAYFLRYSIFLANQTASKSVFFVSFLHQFSFLLIFFSSQQTVSDYAQNN